MSTRKRSFKWWKLPVLALAWACGFLLLTIVLLKWVNPPTTAIQVQRRVESWFAKGRYEKRHNFVPLSRISRDLQHAVVAAEDARFYLHHGFDWKQIREAAEDIEEGSRMRGASTISQQLVKNLFLTTHGTFVRKAAEFAIVPAAEAILGKNRILELYLNVIEWGPGVYGAEAAAQYHYGIPAARVNREQGARLASVLPSPRRRRPARMDKYTTAILERMAQAGW